MLASKSHFLVVVCALAAVLSTPATSPAGPILDWLCGNSPNMTAQTTYVPPYYAPAYETPTYAEPGCNTCTTPTYVAPTYAAPAGGCSSCTPQVVQYTPYASYRPISVARSVTTYYYPGMGCNTCATPVTAYYPSSACSACARPVTAYYAPVAWTQQVRLIPYTTYRMAYMPATYVGYAPACASCVSPCSSCTSPCTYSGCAATVTYGESACASCQPAISSTYVAPSVQTQTSAAQTITQTPSTEVTPQPKTFQEQKPAIEDTKPALPENKNNTEPELKPIPRPETQLNSLPEPRLIDPENRTTLLPVRQALHLTARPVSPVEPAAAPKTGGWREARE